MTIEEFNDKYNEQGGIKILSDMRSALSTQKAISLHFGVSVERVRQWMIEFFGEIYDPREERKLMRVKSIENSIRKNGIEKTKLLYPEINRVYLKTAISNLKK